MGLPWDHRAPKEFILVGTPVGPPWDSHETSNGTLMGLELRPMGSHESPMGLAWVSHGTPIWDFDEIVVLPWDSHGAPDPVGLL